MFIPRSAILRWVTGLVCAATVAACSPSGAPAPLVAPSPAPAVALPGGGSTLSLSPTGPGASSSLTVSEPGYTGGFTASSSNTHVATVSPSSVTSSTAKNARRSDAGSATFTVTAVGPGTATISISDSSGNTTNVPVTVSGATASPSSSPSSSPSASPSASPSVSPSASPTHTPSPSPTPSPTPTPTPGPAGVLTVNPHSVSLVGTGSAYAQSVQVGETGYSGTFGAINNCASIAMITPASAAGPSAVFTVTGVNPGTCSATFSDATSQAVVLSISVTTNGFTIQSSNRKGNQP